MSNFLTDVVIVGDPTSTRDENSPLYISRCKPQFHELVLWE